MRVEVSESVEGLRVVHAPELEALLFNRNLIGWEFRSRCLDASRVLLRAALEDNALESEDLAELILLSKGLVYDLARAYGLETQKNLPTNLIATTRAEVSDEGATILTPYARLDAGGSHLLIGDTVATGSSIAAALDYYRQVHDLTRLTVLSFAGTQAGAQRISRYAQSNGLDVDIFYALAEFAVGDNGFDLSFLHEETVCEDRYREMAVEQFGARTVSAVGWDFGSQALAPQKYRELTWVEAELADAHGESSMGVELEPTRWWRLGFERMAYSGAESALPSEPFRNPD